MTKIANVGPKSPKMPKNNRVAFDKIEGFTKDLIRRTVYEFYDQKRAPTVQMIPWGGGGRTSICGVHGGVPRIRVIFSRKNSEKGISIFHKYSGKGYDISKKFQIGSVILITQMTNQKKTELIISLT